MPAPVGEETEAEETETDGRTAFTFRRSIFGSGFEMVKALFYRGGRKAEEGSDEGGIRKEKDGPGPVMVSDTICPAVHILGT